MPDRSPSVYPLAPQHLLPADGTLRTALAQLNVLVDEAGAVYDNRPAGRTG